MAEVVAPDHLNRHAGGSMSPMSLPGGPRIEMISNPDFSFPIQRPTPLSSRQNSDDESRRPASMHINLPPPPSVASAHKRAASTLPSFTFNSADASGLQDTEETPPQTPDDDAPVTPSRRGHRRGGSEFVGGDSRLGVTNVVSSSPTKTTALPLPAPSAGPPPTTGRGHAHRRSAAMSSHDVGSIMQPAEVQPRLSSSLPNTPLEHPLDASASDPATSSSEPSDPFGPPLEDGAARPPSRPRVGFADNVEYIPRPLSTISSDTESSMSTIRGEHSHSNSINSILSMGTPSPPSSRIPRTSIGSVEEELSQSRAKSSLEISKRIEKEGEWLKSRSGSLKRPLSESAMASPRTTFVTPEPPVRSRVMHDKKHSLSHALGFDPRRSEPTIGMNASESSRLSAISLQESTSGAQSAVQSQEAHDHEHRSSAKKLKQWAASKIHRKSKDGNKALMASSSASSIRPVSEGNTSVPGKVPFKESPVAETDLDAVFSSEETASDSQRASTPPQPLVEASGPTSSQTISFPSRELDEPLSPVLDLDAALGPFKTPPTGSHRPRKELHSNRLKQDFAGFGHYHRRSESAPALPPFEGARVSTPTQSSMADVFEEEEEEDEVDLTQPVKPASLRSGSEDENVVGVQIVDSDQYPRDSSNSRNVEDALGIQQVEWEPERPTTGYGNVSSRFSSVSTEPRGTSIIEDIIMEEASPGETVEIVEAHEEPRASSLTKSSDSSETPTILGPSGTLTLPDGQQSLMTPDTYQTSTFSSPDFGRRQGSFDTSRLGTSASSMTDNRTMSSCATGDQSNELRVSVDDVPSLTSSRSTMLSTMHANNSRREFGSASSASRTPSASSGAVDPTVAAERRRKRGSIQSLSQLVGGSFGPKSKGTEDARPHTAADTATGKVPKKKEHRLKKLMFWKSKQHTRQAQQHES